MDSEIPEELVPCSNCGRTFVKSSLQRHFNVCSKNVKQQRKKFDSSKQRIQGTELEQYLPPPVVKSSVRPRSRSAGGGSRLTASSVPHEQCQHCGRSFSDKAIDRHREWCQSRNAFKQPTPTTSPAYERMQARTKYRAPLTKTLRAKTREKYSSGGIVKDTNHVPKKLPSLQKEPSLSSGSSVTDCTVTPPREGTHSYDVFHSAEQQLQELLEPKSFSPEPVLNTEQDVTDAAERQMNELLHSPSCTPEPTLNTEKDVNLAAERQMKLLLDSPPISPISDRKGLSFPSNDEEEISPLLENICQPTIGKREPASERQLRELLNSKSYSPLMPKKMEKPFSVITSKDTEPIPLPQKMPLSLSQMTSSNNKSTELLIIEDEEEFLINKLAEDAAADKETKYNPPLVRKKKSLNKDQSSFHHAKRWGTLTDDFTMDDTPLFRVKNEPLVMPDQNPSVDDTKQESLIAEISKFNSSSFSDSEKEPEEIRERSFSNGSTTSDLPTEINMVKAELSTFSRKSSKDSEDDTSSTVCVENSSKVKSEESIDDILEGECPLTESLKYLDAALSLFQLEDFPVATRPADAPRSKASTKRRLYSTASPFSLLNADPSELHTPQEEISSDKCHLCGVLYPLPTARFCCQCGSKRAII